MKKVFNIMYEILLSMLSRSGKVSSKILVGTITYSLLILTIVIVTFINPTLPWISDVLIAFGITSAGLLGLTTIENVKKDKNEFKLKREGQSYEQEEDCGI